MLEKGGFSAYTDTFEDLYDLEQLPGLASQNIMSKGIGFGAEGDWKTAALEAVMSEMSLGLDKGLSFIEDYTYELGEGKEAVLGAHMLEISPAIAEGKAKFRFMTSALAAKMRRRDWCLKVKQVRQFWLPLLIWADGLE